MRYSTCKYTVTLKPGLRVTQGHRNRYDRSATYDFLLTFYSNYGPNISYRVRDKWRYRSKSQIFPPPAVFCAPAEEVALGIGYQSWGSKTIVRHIYGTTGPRNKFDIFSCVDTMHQRDGRTDGRTDTGRQQRPRLRIAWRGNQTCCQSLPTADRRHWKNKLMPAHPTSSF